MVKVIDPRNIAQPASARDPGVRIYNPGPAIAQAGRSLEAAARRLDAKEKETAEKEQRVEDLRFLTAYEEAHSRRAESVSEEFRNREADADYVPGVSKRAEGFHKGIISDFGSRYSPSEVAMAQAERLHSRQFTNLRVAARANHNKAAAAQAILTLEQAMDKDALAVASTPDPDVLAGALESIDERVSVLAGSIDPVLLEQKRLEKREDATSNYFLGLLQEGELDLAEQQLRSGDFDKDLGDGTGKSRLLNQIKTERDAIARAAVAAYNKAETEAVKTAANGWIPDTGPMAAAVDQMPRGAVGPARARIDAIVHVSRQYKQFGAAPTAVQQAVLADLGTGLGQAGGVTPMQRLRFEALQKIHDRAATQQKEDATVLVTGAGLAAPIDPSIAPDITNPEYAEEAVRVAEATTAAKGISSDVQTLPRPAYEQVVEGLGSREEGKIEGALTFLSQLPDDPRTNVLDSLGSDVRPAVRVAIGIAGRDVDLAVRIARGDALRADSGGTAGRIMPTNDVVTQAVTDTFGAAFYNSPFLQQELVQAAISLYALDATNEDPTKAQIQAVLTRLVPEDQVQDINGNEVYLAPRHAGFDSAAFKDAVYKAGTTAGSTPLKLTTDVSNRAALTITDGDISSDKTPDYRFAERVGVAYNPSTGQPLGWEGYRLAQVIDADGRPVDLAEISEAQLREQIAPGVYVPYIESSRGTEIAPLRAVYESTDGVAQMVTGFAVSLDKMNALALPTGRVPAKDMIPGDDPLAPLDHMEVSRTLAERLEAFSEANRQFGERFDRNYNRSMGNIEEKFNSGDAPEGPPAPDPKAAERDLDRLRKVERGTPEYKELGDAIMRKYGGAREFADALGIDLTALIDELSAAADARAEASKAGKGA